MGKNTVTISAVIGLCLAEHRDNLYCGSVIPDRNAVTVSAVAGLMGVERCDSVVPGKKTVTVSAVVVLYQSGML